MKTILSAALILIFGFGSTAMAGGWHWKWHKKSSHKKIRILKERVAALEAADRFPVFTTEANLAASDSYVRDLALCELLRPHAPGSNLTMTAGVCEGETGTGFMPLYNFFSYSVKEDRASGFLIVNRGGLNFWSINLNDFLTPAQQARLPKFSDEADCLANKGEWFPSSYSGDSCRYIIAWPRY